LPLVLDCFAGSKVPSSALGSRGIAGRVVLEVAGLPIPKTGYDRASGVPCETKDLPYNCGMREGRHFSDRSQEARERVALYLRVNTREQTVENQRRELTEVADRHGWRIVAEFADEGVSGAKGREKRPGFDRLMKATTRHEIDMVAAWSVDRLGRSLQDLVGFLGEVHGSGVDLYLHQQGIDTSTPAGKALFQMMGVFAEFERAMIQERVYAGLARARAEGKILGRPTVGQEKDAAIRACLAQGLGLIKTAKRIGVGVSVVQRVRASIAA
jgi:DNA invertase Pin-like site-specific DNA recombinase